LHCYIRSVDTIYIIQTCWLIVIQMLLHFQTQS
jgi:hypothetical protein